MKDRVESGGYRITELFSAIECRQILGDEISAIPCRRFLKLPDRKSSITVRCASGTCSLQRQREI